MQNLKKDTAEMKQVISLQMYMIKKMDSALQVSSGKLTEWRKRYRGKSGRRKIKKPDEVNIGSLIYKEEL